MERPKDLRLHRLKLARSKAVNQNPIDFATVAEISMEIQRINNGRQPQQLDPVTQAYVDTIVLQGRGRDRSGNPIFHK